MVFSEVAMTSIAFLALWDTVENFEKYNSCVLPVGVYFIALFSSLTLIGTTRATKNMGLLKNIMEKVERFGFVVMIACFVIGLPLFAIVGILSTKCMRPTLMVVHLMISAIINSILVYLVFVLVKDSNQTQRIERIGRQLKEDINDVYEQIEVDPSFDVPSYVGKYREALKKFEILDREKEILKQKFNFISGVSGTNLDFNKKKGCIICLTDYCKGDKIMIHPGCKHLYHHDCLLGWLGNKMMCPQCKIHTRPSLLLDLFSGESNKLSRRDNSYFKNRSRNSNINNQDNKEGSKYLNEEEERLLDC